MKRILIFGAGRSSTYLIEYLSEECKKNDWQLIVCDADLALAKSKTGHSQKGEAISIDAENDEQRKQIIQSVDIVISMLPHTLHFLVAKDCIEFGKNLLTASYVDENIRSLETAINDKSLLFLCEMGLDPGLDHMSAMKIIHTIKQNGGRVNSFMSHCGGLIAPESDDNPWHYKITWNSRNVVLAGKDGAKYRKENNLVEVPYQAVFRNSPEVHVPNVNSFAWYPNRDSLNYISTYQLEEAATFIRTTLRHPAFCRGWNKLVNIGLTATNDFEKIKNCKTVDEWFDVKTEKFTRNNKNWNNYLNAYITDPFRHEFTKQSHFLGFENKEKLPHGFTCSADILQNLLEKKMSMVHDDKDMVVMIHEIAYETDSKKHEIKSTLVLKGEDSLRTAMAKTVGLPLGIATKLILQQKIKVTGLHIPIKPEIYEPVLSELGEHGITFKEYLT